MRWRPWVNAGGAAAYIGAVVLLLQFLQTQNKPDIGPIDGMGALSLLVFSVAVMGFLFFYRPAVLLIDGNKREALAYFFTTLGIFGAITLAVFAFVALQ